MKFIGCLYAIKRVLFGKYTAKHSFFNIFWALFGSLDDFVVSCSDSREIYYKNVEVIQKQENVNEALRTICCLLNTTPWKLGVLNSSKGLIAGNVKLHIPDCPVIDCSIHKNGESNFYLAFFLKERKMSDSLQKTAQFIRKFFFTISQQG